MRQARDLQCLKVKSYGHAAKTIDEIGRLVGGWSFYWTGSCQGSPRS
jgi:hypothetical protein